MVPGQRRLPRQAPDTATVALCEPKRLRDLPMWLAFAMWHTALPERFMENSRSIVLEFAYEAMRDCRDTIRAIDFKANALLVVLAIFATNIDKVASAERDLIHHGTNASSTIWIIAGVASAGLWLWSFIAACLVLTGSYNPATHIKERSDVTGVFFAPDRFPARSNLWLLWPEQASTSLTDHEAAMDLPPDAILREVWFEHLKLVFIRDLKFIRIRVAYLTGVGSAVLIALLWVTASLNGYHSGVTP